MKREPFWEWYYRSTPVDFRGYDTNQLILSDAPPSYSYLCPQAVNAPAETNNLSEES
jgi:hypothetical protein